MEAEKGKGRKIYVVTGDVQEVKEGYVKEAEGQ